MPTPVYLTDSSSQVWQLGASNSGAWTTTPVSGPTGPTSILLEDTVTSAIWALSVGTSGVLEVTSSSGSPSTIQVNSPNGALFNIIVASGAISTVLDVPAIAGRTSAAVVGVGSRLSFSLNGVTYTSLAQIRKFQGPQSKQTIVDQTNILTPGNGDAPLAARFSSGEAQIDGVVIPQNSSQLTLGQLHANLTLAWWQLLLADGVTVWKWQGFVSEYLPFTLDTMKATLFSAKIRVWGALNGPLGTA
jgi:hypothetical protein